MATHDNFHSSSSSSSESEDGLESNTTDPSTGNPRKRGRPIIAPLEEYKDLIIQLFSVEDVPIIDIARKLNLEHGLDISERTVSRRLTAWQVPRKKNRIPPSQELQDRILFLYNKNLNDDEICATLNDEGHAIKPRNLARLRQKLGMRRRSKYPEFREFSDGEESPTTTLRGDAAPHDHGSSRPISPSKRTKATPKISNALIPKVSGFVEKYMSKYDGSHDFSHIKRVVGLAHLIYNESKKQQYLYDAGVELDLQVITLAALMHDVGDKKYLEPGEDSSTLVLATLLSFGAPEGLAIKVQRIVLGVSYSSEVKDPAQVQAMILKYPELAVVQDADRLDALGAIGIGRTFTFGGAKGGRHMGETIAHFEEKLLKLESMMKTAPGRRLARERAERLNIFKGWWDEEQREAEGSIRKS